MGRSRSKDRYNSRSRSNGKSYEKGRSKQIFVTRISKRTSSQDLRDVFRKYGHIRNVSMKRSYAFIEFSDLSDASLAVEKMNGREIDGSRLVVQIAGERRREKAEVSFDRKRGPQREDVCYNCQEQGHWENKQYQRANECRNPRKPRKRSYSRSRSRSQKRRYHQKNHRSKRSYSSSYDSRQKYKKKDRKRSYSSKNDSKSRSSSSSQSNDKNSKSQSRSSSSEKN